MQNEPPRRSVSNSGLRRSLVRVTADVGVVVARATGDKWHGRMLDVSVGGMQVACDRVPSFGEELTLVVQLHPGGEWLLLPATVRWFTSRGFGAAFGRLGQEQIAELARFIDDNS
jgi:hypothetical protein